MMDKKRRLHPVVEDHYNKISNFILYWTSDNDEIERMKDVLMDYLEDDHVIDQEIVKYDETEYSNFISNINILELASELADKDVEKKLGENRYVDEGGDLYYTEEGQDLFNEFYGEYLDVLIEFKTN